MCLSRFDKRMVVDGLRPIIVAPTENGMPASSMRVQPVFRRENEMIWFTQREKACPKAEDSNGSVI
jgi:hypothetical protein